MNQTSNDHYDSEYIRFQNWHQETFATCSEIEQLTFNAEIKKTKKTFEAGCKVLEIGFGNGSFLQYANNKNWSILGVEINPFLIDLAKNKGFNVIHFDSFDSLEENYFDLIVAFDVLEHLPQSELVQFIGKIKNLLNDKGYFIARFPNGDSPFGLATQNADLTHTTCIGSGKIYQIANKLNLNVIHCRGEVEIIRNKNLILSLYKITTFVIRRLIDFFVYMVFYKRKSFTSTNLIAVFQK